MKQTMKAKVTKDERRILNFLDEHAAAVAERLVQEAVYIPAPVGSNDRIYPLTETIADELRKLGYGYEICGQSIIVETDKIKTTGFYTAFARLSRSITVEFFLRVHDKDLNGTELKKEEW